MSEVPTPPPSLELRRWFEAPSLDTWRAEASRLLKGRPASSLARTLPEGLAVAPLYTRGDVDVTALGSPDAPPYRRGSGGMTRRDEGWGVCGVHDAGDAAAIRSGLAAELAAGATGAWLAIAEGAAPGASIAGADDLEVALSPVELAAFEVMLDAGTAPVAWWRALGQVAARRGVTPGAIRGAVLADPLGAAVAGQLAPDAVNPVFDGVAAVLRGAAEVPGVRVVGVSTLAWAEAGADAVQELAWLLAGGAETLRALDARGVDLNALAGRVLLRVSVGRDTFVELAKLRAVRWVWARLLGACGLGRDVQRIRLHAVASRSLLAARDPWTNLLRGTHAAFVAAVAGADVVSVPPWDRALGLPDDHARRVAATSQAVLEAESHLGAVADPAGGSWYVEDLTRRLAEAAWEAFRSVERRGGLVAAVADGSVGAALAGSRAAAELRVASRDRGVVGVSLFPNQVEETPVRPPAPAPAPFREAAAWEALRAAVEAVPTRPRACLLRVGDRAQARAEFSRPLVQAVGLDVVEAGGGLDVDALVAMWRDGGADGAVLVGHDDDYAAAMPALAPALLDAGARFVLLAGRPDPSWSGLTGSFSLGVDVLAPLADALAACGVTR